MTGGSPSAAMGCSSDTESPGPRRVPAFGADQAVDLGFNFPAPRLTVSVSTLPNRAAEGVVFLFARLDSEY